MEWLGELWQRLIWLFRRDEFRRDLKEEMSEHLRMKAQDFSMEGIPSHEAQ